MQWYDYLYRILETMILFTIGYFLFFRKLKRKKRLTCDATLLSKSCTHLQDSILSCPKIDTLYKLYFIINGKEKCFEVSCFEYDSVKEGSQGLLVYEGNKLISFGDFIKEFHLGE